MTSHATHPANHGQTAPDQTQARRILKDDAPLYAAITDLIKQHSVKNIEPLPLDTGLLLQRIAQKGHSGLFLADAFISAYRTNQPFMHSLGELLKLDAEGFRLFHQILHIRHVPGWSDDGLYHIEQHIKALLKDGSQ